MEDKPEIPGEDVRQALKAVGGRDELNLAEFPITLLSDRVPKGCKTLVFEVEPRDRATGKVAQRRLTITGSDAYGLPTALDDEILVALIQLTKVKNDFTDQEVFFSQYELIEVLRWPHDGRSYARIEESIRRWTGVTLYYDNAWWNKETGTWMDENFHIIDKSSLVARETKRVRRALGQHDLALSSFKWSDVIFRSFQAGSLKRLDVDAYFSFKTSVAKRMYRFLDKRFWVKDRWEFDLKDFAFEHIGLSRAYNVAQIKNKLQPAIDELTGETEERAAFLVPMDQSDRYVKIGKGRWVIIMARKTGPSQLVTPSEPVPEASGLVAELLRRGVTPETAGELVAENPADQVALRLEVFDWLIETKNRRVIKESPVGYLVSSIRNRYVSLPKGFEPKAIRMGREAAKREAEARALEAKKREHEVARREREVARKVKAYWDGLSEAEQARVSEEALEAAGPEAREAYRKQNHRRGGGFADMLFRASIRDPYIRAKLGVAGEPTRAAGD